MTFYTPVIFPVPKLGMPVSGQSGNEAGVLRISGNGIGNGILCQALQLRRGSFRLDLQVPENFPDTCHDFVSQSAADFLQGFFPVLLDSIFTVSIQMAYPVCRR